MTRDPDDLPASTFDPSPPGSAVATTPDDPLRALLVEWFVTYNPLPLASAALVLGGLWIASRELAHRGLLGALGVSAIAELYALALIGGAWVLRRHGHRRSAVMLGLLAALYQCDVTLHLEMCAYLDVAGVLALLAWVALFAIKLDLLGRALELELSASARWTPIVGAACVALVPIVSRWTTLDERSTFTALAIFGVGAAALSSCRAVRAREGFDVRGRRAMRGVQVLFATAALGHVAYACAEMGVSRVPVIAAVLLVGVRVIRHELAVWVVSLGVVAGVAAIDPAFAPLILGLAAASLVLHAVRVRASPMHTPAAPTGPTYRGAPMLDDLTRDDVTTLAAHPIVFTRASLDTQRRVVIGAIGLAYLCLTTWGADTIFSTHHVVVDVGLVVLCAGLFARRRTIAALAPIGLGAVHLAIVEEALVPPRSALELGVWAIASGFAMLGLSVAAHVRLGRPRTVIDG
ncbi:MAG: hypothetical protein J0L92_39790 [Deltaproteobacteria bacterium]|nr:hypothetical protein [Deltaproteobacteria bacterium]